MCTANKPEIAGGNLSARTSCLGKGEAPPQHLFAYFKVHLFF